MQSNKNQFLRINVHGCSIFQENTQDKEEKNKNKDKAFIEVICRRCVVCGGKYMVEYTTFRWKKRPDRQKDP